MIVDEILYPFSSMFEMERGEKAVRWWTGRSVDPDATDGVVDLAEERSPGFVIG